MTPKTSLRRAKSLPPAFFIFLILMALVVILSLLLRMEWRRNRADNRAEQFFSSPWTEKIKIENDGEKYSGTFEDYKVQFTLDTKIQELASWLLDRYDPVLGIFVAMDAETGALLSMASYVRSREKCYVGVCPPVFLRPESRSSAYPMASLVKIVTVAAALESKIVSPDTFRTCRGREPFPDGAVYDPWGIVHGHIPVGDALGFSCNAIFSRLGADVGIERLEDYLGNFMIGRRIEFELPLLESGYAINNTELNVARTGAGFGDVRLSPIHAAAIAASIQNSGIMMKPYFIEKIDQSRGGMGDATIYEGSPEKIARPVKKKTAEAISVMMRATVHKRGGTAYKGFYKGNTYIAKQFVVTGKTGSLDGRTSHEQFTWMIGFVEKGNPKFAFATLILNDEVWKIKAASFTGEFFKQYAAERSQ